MKSVQMRPVRREYRVGDMVPIDMGFLKTAAGVQVDQTAAAVMWLGYRRTPKGALLRSLDVNNGGAGIIAQGSLANSTTTVTNPFFDTAGATKAQSFTPARPGIYTVTFVSTFLAGTTPKLRQHIHYRGVPIRVVQ